MKRPLGNMFKCIGKKSFLLGLAASSGPHPRCSRRLRLSRCPSPKWRILKARSAINGLKDPNVSIGVGLGPLIGVGPSGRTGSGYWIDHLPGVLLLKLDRTDIAES